MITFTWHPTQFNLTSTEPTTELMGSFSVNCHKICLYSVQL